MALPVMATAAMWRCRPSPHCSFEPACAPHLSNHLWPAEWCKRVSALKRPTWQQPWRAARGSLIIAAAGPSDVFVLDLDGVIVDSEPEVCHMTAQLASVYDLPTQSRQHPECGARKPRLVFCSTPDLLICT